MLRLISIQDQTPGTGKISWLHRSWNKQGWGKCTPGWNVPLAKKTLQGDVINDKRVGPLFIWRVQERGIYRRLTCETGQEPRARLVKGFIFALIVARTGVTMPLGFCLSMSRREALTPFCYLRHNFRGENTSSLTPHFRSGVHIMFGVHIQSCTPITTRGVKANYNWLLSKDFKGNTTKNQAFLSKIGPYEMMFLCEHADTNSRFQCFKERINNN